MTDTKSLQDLVNYVNAMRQKLDAASLCSAQLLDSNRDSLKSSQFHSKFSALTQKFCVFAEEYQWELDQFSTSLLNNIRLNHLKEKQQEIERERLQIAKEIEGISGSNMQVFIKENNVYSATSSIQSSIDYDSKAEEDAESVAVLTIPATAIQKVAPVHHKCVETKTVSKMPLVVKKETVTKSTPKRANISRENAKPQNISRKIAKPNKVKVSKQEKAPTKKNVAEDKHQTSGVIMAKPYVYNAKKVQWTFDHKRKSSTVIFIGNLPSDSTQKKIEFWLMQRAHVTISQIASVRLNRNARGMYALVRFNPSVSLQKIEKFMNKINKENDEIYADSKKSKKGKVVSWKKRVFVKFNRAYIKSGDAMWNDVSADHRVVIRNFDILNEKCHYELTHLLLEYGDLYKDIEIRADSFGEPFCVAIFKYINDAIYFRNSEIKFYGRMLDTKYAQY